MDNKNACKRVVIDNVLPPPAEGIYLAKGGLGEEFIVSADVFSDGHDELQAILLIKHAKDRQWKEKALLSNGNDRYAYRFVPEHTGIYRFKVLAWIDHFATWKKGIQKKYEAGQDISVEWLIGAEMMENACNHTGLKNEPALQRLSKKLRNIKDPQEGFKLVMKEEVEQLVHRCRNPHFVTEYPEIIEFEIERKKASFSTWYEMFPRSASREEGKHGTFRDVKKLLPRIAGMGFDVLYFPPIHPIGYKHRKGKNNSLSPAESDPGSPWAIGSKEGGHKSIHPQLGTLKDFKELLKAAESHGIEIALDLALQCAPDHPYIKEHPQWFLHRPDGTIQYAENPPKKYEDIVPFNFETADVENLWKELKSIVDYWISQGVKIFRVDNPHTKAFAFWQWMIGKVRKKNPEIIFLAEAFTRPRIMERLAKIGFNQSYTYFTWRHSKKELEEYLTELTQSKMRYYFRPNFWPNTPDILMEELVSGGENAHLIRLLLAATLSSNYGLYGPVYEFAINKPHPGKEEYTDNEKYEIKHWDWEKDTRLRKMITLLNGIRKENPALQSTWNIRFAQSDNEKIICYCKSKPENNNKLIIAVNLDPFYTQSGHVFIDEKQIEVGDEYTVNDLLSGNSYQWKKGWNYVALDPNNLPAHLFLIQE